MSHLFLLFSSHARFLMGAKCGLFLICLILLSPFILLILKGGGEASNLNHHPLANSTQNTLILLFLSALGAGSMGVISAWLVGFYRFWGSKFLSFALFLPLAIPPYLVAMTYGELLDYAGIVQTGLRELLGVEQNLWSIRSLIGASFIFSISLYPYTYLFARAVFANQSERLLEVADLSGLDGFGRFTRVILPMALPSVVVSVLLVLMEVLADYGVVGYFGVNSFSSLLFRTWFGVGDFPFATLVAFVMFLVVVVLLLTDQFFRRKVRYYQHFNAHQTAHTFKNKPLKPPFALLAFTLSFLPVFLGFFIPVGVLFSWLHQTTLFSWIKLFNMLADTLFICFLSAFVVLLVAFVVVYLKRLSRVKGYWLTLLTLATSGYAMPGLMIAVGVMMVLSGLEWLFESTALLMGFNATLFLGGSLLALVFGLTVRFLTSAFNMLDSSLAQITPSMDECALLLGASSKTIVLQIHRPLITPAFLVALCLVVFEVAKELPLMMVLRPFNLEPLSMHIWQMASDERVFEVAPYALCLIAMLVILALLGFLGQKLMSQFSLKAFKPHH